MIDVVEFDVEVDVKLSSWLNIVVASSGNEDEWMCDGDG